MQRRKIFLGASALLLSAACSFSPKVDPSKLHCKDENGCPSGYRCVDATVDRLGFCCNKPDAAACFLPPDAASAPTDGAPTDESADGKLGADGSVDAFAEGRVTGDGAADKPEDVSSPDSGADVAGGGLDVGGGEISGGSDAGALDAADGQPDVPIGGTDGGATGGSGGGGDARAPDAADGPPDVPIAGAGGNPGTGGIAGAGAGGNSGAGGTTSTNDAGTGGVATGGTSTGGVTTSAGGTTTAGGATASGGTTSAGGNTTAGGTTGSGGTVGTGGTGGATSQGDAGPAVGSTGCGKTSTITFGPIPHENADAGAGSASGVGTGQGGYVTIQSSGQTRGFAMRLPDNYDNNHPYWLIFGFHGNGGDSAQVDNGGSNGYWWSYYGLQRKSNNGAIFVAPAGLSGNWANSGGQDVTFVDDMVKLIEDNYCVDTTRLITTGFSYGAGMSYAIACARASVFHAAVLYEAGVLSRCDGGNDPIALMMIQGLRDGTTPIGSATTGAIPMRDKFVTNNGCTPMDPALDNPGTALEPNSAPPYLDPGGHICTNYSGCSAGHPLRWCVHQSGHIPAPVDGTSDSLNSCATPPESCSATCPCTWTPDDVWTWLTDPSSSAQTPNATSML